MSTAANHRKRSHRSERAHRYSTAKRYVKNIREQDYGFGIFGALFRKLKKLKKGREKKTNAGSD